MLIEFVPILLLVVKTTVELYLVIVKCFERKPKLKNKYISLKLVFVANFTASVKSWTLDSNDLWDTTFDVAMIIWMEIDMTIRIQRI